MATAPIVNTFEGGTDATDITTGNSGGASGTPFSAVTAAAGALQFASAQARGALSMVVIEPSTYAATHASWTGLGIAGGVDVYFRAYMFLPASMSGNSPGLVRFLTAAPATSATLRPATTVKVQFQNAASTSIAASLGAVTIATAQWIRIEIRHRASTTVGEIEWRLYNTPDAVVADETVTVTGQALGADTDGIRIGQITSTGIASSSIYFDDVAVSTTGWIGPSTAPPDITMAPFVAAA